MHLFIEQVEDSVRVYRSLHAEQVVGVSQIEHPITKQSYLLFPEEEISRHIGLNNYDCLYPYLQRKQKSPLGEQSSQLVYSEQ